MWMGSMGLWVGLSMFFYKLGHAFEPPLETSIYCDLWTKVVVMPAPIKIATTLNKVVVVQPWIPYILNDSKKKLPKFYLQN